MDLSKVLSSEKGGREGARADDAAGAGASNSRRSPEPEEPRAVKRRRTDGSHSQDSSPARTEERISAAPEQPPAGQAHGEGPSRRTDSAGAARSDRPHVSSNDMLSSQADGSESQPANALSATGSVERQEATGASPAAPDVPSQIPSPYADLQRAVHAALESRTPALTTGDKVALALEVLRARQLELDLAQARNNIEAIVTKTGSAPRTLRSVIPTSTVRGLPIGTPIEITSGKFLLSPTTNDPQALFLTLELQSFGQSNPTSASGQPVATRQANHANPASSAAAPNNAQFPQAAQEPSASEQRNSVAGSSANANPTVDDGNVERARAVLAADPASHSLHPNAPTATAVPTAPSTPPGPSAAAGSSAAGAPSAAPMQLDHTDVNRPLSTSRQGESASTSDPPAAPVRA